MLDVILIICLVVFAIAWLVSIDWDCLMCLWKNHALFLLYGSILLWFSPLMLYLGWLGACLHHVWLQTSLLKPLWSFGFWLVIPLYALVNNVLSLCMIMTVIALLVGRSLTAPSWRGRLFFFNPRQQGQKSLIVVRWCVVDTRKLVGKPQEQGYDEHNNKFSLSRETKVYQTSRSKNHTFECWCPLALRHSGQWRQDTCRRVAFH
jgi:hypothetical protein